MESSLIIRLNHFSFAFCMAAQICRDVGIVVESAYLFIVLKYIVNTVWTVSLIACYLRREGKVFFCYLPQVGTWIPTFF